ncbi:MAG: hypothetical protein IJ875_03605, partial [Solobacterium sp.]|nr:hypothetical protein [Solobacterium sp.]
SIDIQGSYDVDFPSIEIRDGNGEVIQEGKSSATHQIELMSIHSLRKTFSINGYTIYLTTNQSGLKAEVVKKTENGLIYQASVGIQGIKVDYVFNSEEKEIQDAYFKLNYHLQEGISVKKKYEIKNMLTFLA